MLSKGNLVIDNSLTLFRSKIYYLSFIAFFCYILLQYSFVYLYHDDYGLANLTYIFNVKDSAYNSLPINIFIYVKKFYYGWSGRALFLYFFISVIQSGMFFYRIFQAIMVTLVIYLAYKNVEPTISEENKIECSVIPCILYGLIDISILNAGAYWGGASAFYVWPMTTLFLLTFLYGKSSTFSMPSKLLLLLLSLISGASFEGVAIITTSYLAINIISEIWRKTYHKLSLSVLCFFMSLAGNMFLFLAPGNFARFKAMHHQDDVGIFKGIIRLAGVTLSDAMHVYIVIASIIVLLITLVIARNLVKMKLYHRLMLLINTAGMICVVLIKPRYLYDYIPHHNSAIIAIIMISSAAYCVSSLSVLTVWLYNKNRNISYLLLASILSYFAMIGSPVVAYRSMLPFIFISMIIITQLCSDIKSELCKSISTKIIYTITLCCLAVLSIVNAGSILRGYYRNSLVHEENILTIKTVKSKIDSGIAIPNLVLKKLLDDRYAETMPYNREIINGWLLEYYKLPATTKVEWR